MATVLSTKEPRLSSRQRALIRFAIGTVVSLLITLPFFFRLKGDTDARWIEITGSFFLVLEATFHRITDTVTVNAWLVKIGLGKDDIRTPLQKSKDRRKIRALNKQLKEGNEQLKPDTDGTKPPDTGKPV